MIIVLKINAKIIPNNINLIGLGENEYEVCNISLDYFQFDCFLIAGRYTLFEQSLPENFLYKCHKSKYCDH